MGEDNIDRVPFLCILHLIELCCCCFQKLALTVGICLIPPPPKKKIFFVRVGYLYVFFFRCEADQELYIRWRVQPFYFVFLYVRRTVFIIIVVDCFLNKKV